MTSQEKAFREFSDFAAKLKGDEKSEAQTFLFHLLAAFGHDPNTLPENSTFEYRVRFPILRGIGLHPSVPFILLQVFSCFPGPTLPVTRGWWRDFCGISARGTTRRPAGPLPAPLGLMLQPFALALVLHPSA